MVKMSYMCHSWVAASEGSKSQPSMIIESRAQGPAETWPESRRDWAEWPESRRSTFTSTFTNFPPDRLIFPANLLPPQCPLERSLMLAFLPAIRVYAARKFFLDNVDPDRPIDIRYFKKNQNSWLTEFINFTGLYCLQVCIKQSYWYILLKCIRTWKLHLRKYVVTGLRR